MISFSRDPVVEVCRRLRIDCLRHVPLAARTTWKIGGAARWVVQPASVSALGQFLSALPPEFPRLILGGGSNLLIDDGGFQGVVVDLRCHMHRMAPLPPSSCAGAGRADPPGQAGRVAVCHNVHRDTVVLQVEAGAATRALAHFARRHGLAGAEFLGGIPGSLGGALRMNAGAYGGEMQDIVVDACLLDTEGGVQTLSVAQLGMGYRATQVPSDWIFLSARLRLWRSDAAAVRARMRAMNRTRRASQPLAFPSAGSTFKNPRTGPKAWQWIDEAGLRGACEGGAQVSEKHSNFLINRGGAKSRDVRVLMDRIQDRVVHIGGECLMLEVGIVSPSGLVADGRDIETRKVHS